MGARKKVVVVDYQSGNNQGILIRVLGMNPESDTPFVNILALFIFLLLQIRVCSSEPINLQELTSPARRHKYHTSNSAGTSTQICMGPSVTFNFTRRLKAL